MISISQQTDQTTTTTFDVVYENTKTNPIVNSVSKNVVLCNDNDEKMSELKAIISFSLLPDYDIHIIITQH